MLLFAGLCLLSSASSGALSTNNDPAHQIRFDTAAEADARRQQLVSYIWDSGLPIATQPQVSSNIGASIFSTALSGIDPSLVSQVKKIDANVSNFDFHSISYLLTPTNSSHLDRFVIVHQGHTYNPLEAGVSPAVNSLLAQGFSVSIMQMPIYGWNSDVSAIAPGNNGVLANLTYSNHASIINQTGPVNGGMGFRLFLEPVIQNVNYILTLPNVIDVSMTGISGGGWTTSMVAAIDARISVSVPVAGSAPLYVRNNDGSSLGDLEQYYEPMYDENIALDGSGGGIATWLEIYALGGYGAGRHQVMVTNRYDNCCFSGDFADAFDDIVSANVDLLAAGAWDYYKDTTSTIHQIAPNTLSQVLFPALGVVRKINGFPEPGTVPEPSVFGLVGLALLLLERRRSSTGRCSAVGRT